MQVSFKKILGIIESQLLVNAIKESGLMDDLEKSGMYTLFVPVDKANMDHENGKLTVNQSNFLFTDTEAQNGVLHFIYPAISEQ